MKDFFADLYDDERRNGEEGEPSFSLYDFRKWLSKQDDEKPVTEARHQKEKDDLKEEFKKRVRQRKKKD